MHEHVSRRTSQSSLVAMDIETGTLGKSGDGMCGGGMYQKVPGLCIRTVITVLPVF